MKKRILALLTAMLLCLGTFTSYATGFTDLKDSKGKAHWSAVYINDISSKGLVSGYSDGTFRPNSSVSRVDAVVFMTRLYPAEIVSSTYAQNKDKWTKKLTDNQIPDYAKSAVVFALENSWFGEAYLKEFVDSKTKKPKDAMRYEFCVYLVRALNWEPLLSNAAVVKYEDSNTIVKQAVAYIELLGRKGIVATTGKFYPNKTITRGETAKMLSLAYPNSEKAKGTTSTNTNQNNNNNSNNTNTNTDNSGKVVMPSGVIVEGIIKYMGVDDNNIVVTIEDTKGNILSFSNKTNGVVVAIDGKQAYPENIKTGYEVKLYTDGTTVKGIEAESETDVNKTVYGEILVVKSSSIRIRTDKGKLEEYDVSSRADIIKDKKDVRITDLTEGDDITAKVENSVITKIEAKAIKRTFKNVVIKGLTVNSSSSAKLIFSDEYGDVREMNLNSNSYIYMKNKKVSISDIKVGYEADVYANSNDIIDLTLYSQTKGEVFTGTIDEVNIKEDYLYIKDKEGKSKKVVMNSKTEIYDYITNKMQYARDLAKGQSVIITGYEGIDVIEAIKISYY